MDFVEFARAQFELEVRDQMGSSVREHLESIHRQTGVMPEQLANAPQLPDGCKSLWDDFLNLHNTRSTGIGPGRIGYVEIDAYQRVEGVRFKPWQVIAIRGADNAFFAVEAERKAS